MSRQIDPTKPIDGVLANKADLRSNLQSDKDEIEALQSGKADVGHQHALGDITNAPTLAGLDRRHLRVREQGRGRGMVRFSRREGIFLMLGASQALLLGAASAAVTYDDLVDTFDIPPDSSVVSYWKFENDGADEKGTQDAVITGSPELNVDTLVDHDTISEGAPVDGKCIAWSGTTGVHARRGTTRRTAG
jgi:hypothetical protein